MARPSDQGRSVSPRSIENTGRKIGHELAPTDAADSTEALARTLAALGFQPTMHTGDGDAVTFCLGNCPYRDAVHEDPPAICALHKGITRGLLDVLEPNARLTKFVSKNPDEAGCLIGVHGLGQA